MEESEQKQGAFRWSGNLGFIMASAGAAVGMGNLWRFPMLAGQGGGGAFVLIYLVCIAAFGIPMLIAEISLGRRGRKDAFESYRSISPKWGAVGILAIVTSLVGLAYYTVLGGWVLHYILASVTGLTAPETDAAAHFSAFTADAGQQALYYAAYMAITLGIVMAGVAKGIEKACKVMLPLLFLFLAAMAVRSCTLPGASEGLEFYLKPDFSKLTPGVWLSALGQVFFSLSVGAGAGITYGSYLDKKASIPRNAAIVAGFDTLAALLAGFAILPAVFSAGLTPEIGPGLMFIVLPEVFQTMPGGAAFSLLFFVLVLFASVTTTIAFLEVVVSFVVRTCRVERKKASLLCAGLATLLGIPCAFSFGMWSGATLFGKTLFDLTDYTVSNICLPISAILTCIFIGWVWKPKNAVEEATSGGLYFRRLAKPWSLWVKYAMPLLIFFIFLSSTGILG